MPLIPSWQVLFVGDSNSL